MSFAGMLRFDCGSPLATLPADALGGFVFAAADALPSAFSPGLVVAAPTLLPATPVCELWQTSGGIAQGTLGGVSYRHTDAVLFGSLVLPEVEAAEPGTTPLTQAAYAGYRTLFGAMDALGFPALWRVWNYMADINVVSHGLERYRQFNIGRHQAFDDGGRPPSGKAAAACALGSRRGPLQIAFLAGRTPALAIENPRQVAAYAYPSDYGPRSPTFARGGVVRLGGECWLFVSGTASIVGHRSLHSGDVRAQTREVLVNIDALVDEAQRRKPALRIGLGDLAYTVYVRHAADLAAVREELASRLPPATPLVYVQADVCRAELLVEIEACGSSLPQ